jgi:hypothetical protein
MNVYGLDSAEAGNAEARRTWRRCPLVEWSQVSGICYQRSLAYQEGEGKLLRERIGRDKTGSEVAARSHKSLVQVEQRGW